MNITTVTQRIKQIKQPPRGYLPIQKFRVEILPTNKRISSSQEHGVSPQITGIVVQYLTQRVMDPVMSTSEIFSLPIKGYKNQMIMRGNAPDNISQIKKKIDNCREVSAITNEVIDATYSLCRYEMVYRSRKIIVNEKAPSPSLCYYSDVREMINRSVNFFQKEGPIVYHEFDIAGCPPSPYIQKGDGDYVTKTALIDMKVISGEPNKDMTLQQLCYWILCSLSEDIKKRESGRHSPF